MNINFKNDPFWDEFYYSYNDYNDCEACIKIFSQDQALQVKKKKKKKLQETRNCPIPVKKTSDINSWVLIN